MEFNADRLFAALQTLKESVENARRKLEVSCSDDTELRARIDSYEEIIKKQSKLAAELKEAIEHGSGYDRARLVHLLTALTSFIYDDAQDLSATLSSEQVIIPEYRTEKVLN